MYDTRLRLRTYVLVCLERGAKNVIKDKTHTHTHTYELKKKNFKRGEDTKLRR